MKEKYYQSESIQAVATQLMDRLREEIDRVRKPVFKPDESSLLVADMQYYFTDPENHAYIPSSGVIIPIINTLIDFYHEIERPVFFTKHSNNSSNAGMMNRWWRDVIDINTQLSEIDHRLHAKGSTVIEKHQYDAFYQTELEELLRQSATRQLTVCGVMTNLCCETTVRSAFVRGFEPIFPIDATATYNKVLHQATFRNLAFGFTPLLTSAELIKHLQA